MGVGAAAGLLAGRLFWAERQLLEGGQAVQEQDPVQWVQQPDPAQDPEHAWQQELGQMQWQRQETPGLAAELALNRMLLAASHEQRLEVIAVAWDLKEHGNGWMDRLLRRLGSPDSADLHNKAYFLAALCYMHILDKRSAAEALLGLRRLQGARPALAIGPQGGQRMHKVTDHQAETLRVNLLDHQQYLHYLPADERDAALIDLEADIRRAERIKDESARAARAHIRWWCKMGWFPELTRSCYRAPAIDEVLDL
ncbi:hypothetical protein ABPG75_000097 [Micractinium tetrahymenae]